MTIPYSKIDSLYIGGQWVKPASGKVEANINPASEALISNAPVGGLAEAEAAISVARETFDTHEWPHLSIEQRIPYIRAMLDEIRAKAAGIKDIQIAEGGVTRRLAESMYFEGPMRMIEALLKNAARMQPEFLPVETAFHPLDPTGPKLIGSGQIVREPAGVVTAITPYNAPFMLNLCKLIPALLAGCTVILKPSPLTPCSALLFGEIADAAGLPKGTLSIVTGDLDVSQLLTSDPRVDLVTFTGSDVVGAQIMGQAAPTLKRVLLELGGKSALIVREDADIMKAALEGVFQVSNHCGQGCALATRHIVHNSIRKQYVEAMQAMSAQITSGDPTDPNTVVGPLISAAARERVEKYVQIGQDEGAQLVFGGTRPDHMEKGYFFNVTVFDDVENSMRIAQEEIFGPVASVIGFDSDDEAIKIANDSRFGLYGGIHSADAAKAYEMALRVRTGGVVLNGGLYKEMDAPFGGYKASGIGREFGPHWLEEYTEQKTIIYPIGR